MTATDGAEGLRLAEQDPPDLIITDLNMPKLDGWRVCQHLKEAAGSQDVPVIMLSALVENTSNPSDVELGDCYLSKPFKMTDLLREIQRLLPD